MHIDAEIRNAAARTRQNRRIFARALLSTVPVVAGYFIGGRILQYEYGSTHRLLVALCGMAAVGAFLLTLHDLSARALYMARSTAFTPRVRIVVALALLAFFCIFLPLVFYAWPILALVLTLRWLFHNDEKRPADAPPSIPSPPLTTVVMAISGQAACGAALAVAWKYLSPAVITESIASALRGTDTPLGTFCQISWMVLLPLAFAGVAWFWLLYAISRITLLLAAMETKRGGS